jgi:hypothetical protein
VLGGTFIQGKKSMAIINGEVYAPGDSLAGSQSKGQKWIVKHIAPEEVVIQSGTETRKITYAAPAAQPLEEPDSENNAKSTPSKREKKQNDTSKRNRSTPIKELIEQLKERQERLQKGLPF